VDGTPFGRYRLIELLGRGGMGEVWRAHDTAIDRMVAIKMLLPHFAQDKTFEQRFRREARAAARLDDPHVVPIYDVGEIEGRLFVTMRLIKGRDLQDLLHDGPLPPGRAVWITEQIASALQAAHEVGLVHRDVKPSNILVAKDDFAYLIDFGIARSAGETGLTSTGATIGTWAYMAPERLNTGHADARADIYALACVLHEAMTGQRPYRGDSLEQQIVGHLTTPPPRPSTLQPAVPTSLDAVIATGMAKDPDQRYPTTNALAQAARAALTTPIRQPSPVRPTAGPDQALTTAAAFLSDRHANQHRPPPPTPTPCTSNRPETSHQGSRDAPRRLTSYITDEAGALSKAGRVQVESATETLRNNRKIRLWVVYVRRFTGKSAAEWASKTIKLSDFGNRDALLAVAVVDRAYSFLIDSGIDGITPAQVKHLRLNQIQPALQRNDWSGAAVAAAHGLRRRQARRAR
jgi:serine/threonine protein kinase